MHRGWTWLVMAMLLTGASACGDHFDAGGSPAEPICGNGIIEQGESCDDGNVAGNDCTTIGQGFTSGALACSPSCDDWDTAGCVAGKGQLVGTLSVGPGVSCEPLDETADCEGTTWILVFENDPAQDLAQLPVATGVLADVDLSDGKTASYAMHGVLEGTWYLTGFMDDDGNASALSPSPDAGDPIAFPALLIEIVHGNTAEQDLTLGLLMP